MDSLSRIGSLLERPVYADECTTNIDRVSYARMLIEMDVTKPLPESIKARDPMGKIFDQEIKYDWKPVYCPSCLQSGYRCQDDGQTKATPPDQGMSGKQKTMWLKKKDDIQDQPQNNQLARGRDQQVGMLVQ
uniref:Uncharacterized protein n=1 Tax=Nicotiana tabacum TaxID=4097 RepID=A0A1S3XCN9_TOBAC|nr:PREDICTED: uncharacterized protein LOC107763707 [Nicotiana tabacum]